MNRILYASFFALFSFLNLDAAEASYAKIKTLYASLDLSSVSEHLAFYDLYPNTAEGKKALEHAALLLFKEDSLDDATKKTLANLPMLVKNMVFFMSRPANAPLIELEESELSALENFVKSQHMQKLKGHFALSEQEVLELPDDQVDLARSLFLAEMGPGKENINKIRTYEALLDLMALQIRARLKKNAVPQEVIEAINYFIFDQMGFRFPPQSTYGEAIDQYTFLPSVLDSRKGVCLGVSILYISVAQRLGIHLDMVTPPGHIFVSYSKGNACINIETTARGIHVDSEEYLGINTCALQKRTIKEVIGLAFYNKAAVHWKFQEYEKAYDAYLKAKCYMPEDKHLTELMGYIALLIDKDAEGTALLESVENYTPDFAVFKDTMAEDYLAGRVDKEGIKIVFLDIEDSVSFLTEHQKRLQEYLKKFPRFRFGYMCLASVFLKLHRYGQALDVLESYHAMEKQDPAAGFYLAELYAMRLDYPKAWLHLQEVEDIVKLKHYYPNELKQFRTKLSQLFPK